MPHLTLEYTQNLDRLQPVPILKRLAKVMLASGQFQENDIKGRVMRLDEAIVGTGDAPASFIHLKVYLLSGRTEEVRAALAQELMIALKEEVQIGTPVQLTVDIAEMTRATYMKESIG
jgi:5-carboxymethyl-2-hydroxymuconate isomerase